MMRNDMWESVEDFIFLRIMSPSAVLVAYSAMPTLPCVSQHQ
jgi:hypothetical protein